MGRHPRVDWWGTIGRLLGFFIGRERSDLCRIECLACLRNGCVLSVELVVSPTDVSDGCLELDGSCSIIYEIYGDGREELMGKGQRPCVRLIIFRIGQCKMPRYLRVPSEILKL